MVSILTELWKLLYSVAPDALRKENACGKRTVLSDWTWAASNYDFTIGKSTIKKITIDPSGLMADVKQENNVYKQ
jgi:hypothetical protein